MRKWIHRALKGASLTTALFVFQACYGTPPVPAQAESEIAYEQIEETIADEAPADEAVTEQDNAGAE